MTKIAVIIPFYQRDHGILSRALGTIFAQVLPPDTTVDVWVIDDASPIAADDEIAGLAVPSSSFALHVVRQENGGPGAARNRGLDAAHDADLIAFLDSDDLWPHDHLARAMRATSQGFDFYFTDNSRPGHHLSHCRSPFVTRTKTFLDQNVQKSGLLPIPTQTLVGLVIREFPCQASTVVYRRTIAPDLRFDVRLRASGEDLLFFTNLTARAQNPCIDLDSMVTCGEGVNIYFSNLGWNSPKFLAIQIDGLLTALAIDRIPGLDTAQRAYNAEMRNHARQMVAFHLVRRAVNNPSNAARQYGRLWRINPMAAARMPLDVITAAINHRQIRKKTS